MFGGTSSSEDGTKPPKKKAKKRDRNRSASNYNGTSVAVGNDIDIDIDRGVAATTSSTTNKRQDGFDDSEGYYKASIGETMEVEVAGGGVVAGEETEDGPSASVGADGDRSAPMPTTALLKLRVLGVIGKGVFSSVLKCSTSTSTSTLPPEVAIKCIRSNETMAKAALNEIKFLIRLKDNPGIVPLLLPTATNAAATNTTNNATQHNNHNSNSNHNSNATLHIQPIEFRNHTLLFFPYLPYNLRDVLQKFGKGVGLALGAVRNYFGQLLKALGHLQRHRILHADLKPDNVLVSADFSTVLLADFGSAVETKEIVTTTSSTSSAKPTPATTATTTSTTTTTTSTSGADDKTETSTTDPTKSSTLATTMPMSMPMAGTNEVLAPYLVSRFYRAPEIMLGLQPLTHAVDLWSLAVAVGELFLGTVLLTGCNNNEMLFSMMNMLGPFSGRMIKSHLLQTKKLPLPAHFSQVQSNYVFRQETVDPILGQAVHKEISLVNTFKPTLQSKLLKAKSPKDSRADVLRFADLLTKCLVLDPSRRTSVQAALKHDFFRLQKK